MSHSKCIEHGCYFRRVKKKSDEYLKSKADEKVLKAAPVPVHGIKEEDLADKSFSLPKIPQRKDVLPTPGIQLSMAEIVEQSDAIANEKAHENEEVENFEVLEKTSDTPELSIENLKKCNDLFAEKQKVSIVSLIKLLEPELIDNQLIFTMTKQQEEFIGDIKIEWQSHFRSYFKNREIQLQIKTDDLLEAKRKAYTPSEQFQEMLETNELFKSMVQKFKLKLKQ